jgi:hypothetical protein
MNGNEAGVSRSSGQLKRLLTCFILLTVFVVIKAKIAALEERNSVTDRSVAISAEETEAPPGSGEPEISDFMVESDSKVLLVNLSESEKAAKQYYPIILKASRKHNVDPHLITAIIMTESGFNPRAVSRVGAKGLMQIMPRTARSLGLKDVFNPEKNIEADVRYFKRLLDRFGGNVRLALAAYNAGSRSVNEHGGIPPKTETIHFVRKVSRLHQEFKKSEPETVAES